MEQEELIKLLKHVDSVTVSDWDIVKKLVSGIDEGEIFVLRSERFDWKKNYMDSYPLDLSRIEEWQTFEIGIELRFKFSDGSLICYAEIWDTSSNMSDIYRSGRRWSAELILKSNFIAHISLNIVRKFNLLADYKYDEYLNEVKKLWIENYKQSILNS